METRAAAGASQPSGQRTRMTLPPRVSLRAAAAADVPAIARIYREQVATGTASFEYDPPAVGEMMRRYEVSVAAGFPWFVADDDTAGVVGYTFASPYRPRPGYRYTVEDSVYVAAGAAGRGIGGALLAQLIEACTARGDRLMVAVIGDVANGASIAVHRRQGFAAIGRMPGVGWKFDRWIESVLMQRVLGEGTTAPPAPR